MSQEAPHKYSRPSIYPDDYAWFMFTFRNKKDSRLEPGILFNRIRKHIEKLEEEIADLKADRGE